MYSNDKYYLWTPLVGFDMDKADRGVDEYFSKIKSHPKGIALFVFNADIVYMHKGMEEEFEFPFDYCNYYGAPRNELRNIQKWSNYKFKELIANIKNKKVETYISIMGNHTVPRDRIFFAGNFGYIANQDFLVENEEACIEGTSWTGNTYVLKRLKDGSYFEDFFIQATLKVLEDYDADGVHISDGIFPPTMQLQDGDFSFDMMEQFANYSKIKFPEGIVSYVKGNKFTDIKERAKFIWKNYRAEWIRFVSWRWNGFLTKLCNGLHAHGKKVMVNNCWMSEPFESLYRYGIDYKSLSTAGVDVVCQEQQASIIKMNEGKGFTDCLDEHYCKSMIMKAYSGEPECVTISFAKDSTEEASMITHLPLLCESEQFQLANYYIYEDGHYKRAIDGFFVDLADALTNAEWDWLIDRYEKIFKEEEFDLIAPTLVWNDAYMNDCFLKDYIKTRRWSAHRYVSYLNKHNAGIRAICKFSDLDTIDADLFIPNVDLLSDSDIEKIKAYKNGVVVVTLSKGNDNFNFSSIRFEDESVADGLDRPVCYVINAKESFEDEIKLVSTIKDDSPDLDFNNEIIDTSIWKKDIIFRKVSMGFLEAIAKILKKVTVSRHKIELLGDKDYTIVKLKNGAKRLIFPNRDLNRYDNVKVRVNEKFIKVVNVMDFPAQPLKLLVGDGQAVADLGNLEISNKAIGFLVKTAPGGIAVTDIFTK